MWVLFQKASLIRGGSLFVYHAIPTPGCPHLVNNPSVKNPHMAGHPKDIRATTNGLGLFMNQCLNRRTMNVAIKKQAAIRTIVAPLAVPQ